MVEHYFKVSPQLDEPLYMRSVRKFIPVYREWCERCISLLTRGELVYSIVGCFSILNYFIWIVSSLVHFHLFSTIPMFRNFSIFNPKKVKPSGRVLFRFVDRIGH